MRGFENFSTRIYVPTNRELTLALETGAGGPEGDGPCENKVYPPQSLSVSYVPVSQLDYFDVLVSAQYNDGNCETNVRRVETTIYRFRSGKYLPLMK